MTLKREQDIAVPEYARPFVEGINSERIQRGDLPLSEEQTQRIVDKLQELKNDF